MAKPPIPTQYRDNPSVNLPLPDYVKAWGVNVYRPKTLPPLYDDRIDPTHIFVLSEHPDVKNEEEEYIVAHRCTQCSRVRKVCSRGDPKCSRCTEKGLTCVPAEAGYVELPLIRLKKPALRQEVQALKKSLPDAPYYRDHSVSVAKSMAMPDANSAALRKGPRASVGQESASSVRGSRRGDTVEESASAASVSKRGMRRQAPEAPPAQGDTLPTTSSPPTCPPVDSAPQVNSTSSTDAAEVTQHAGPTRPHSLAYIPATYPNSLSVVTNSHVYGRPITVEFAGQPAVQLAPLFVVANGTQAQQLSVPEGSGLQHPLVLHPSASASASVNGTLPQAASTLKPNNTEASVDSANAASTATDLSQVQSPQPQPTSSSNVTTAASSSPPVSLTVLSPPLKQQTTSAVTSTSSAPVSASVPAVNFDAPHTPTIVQTLGASRQPLPAVATNSVVTANVPPPPVSASPRSTPTSPPVATASAVSPTGTASPASSTPASASSSRLSIRLPARLGVGTGRTVYNTGSSDKTYQNAASERNFSITAKLFSTLQSSATSSHMSTATAVNATAKVVDNLSASVSALRRANSEAIRQLVGPAVPPDAPLPTAQPALRQSHSEPSRTLGSSAVRNATSPAAKSPSRSQQSTAVSSSSGINGDASSASTPAAASVSTAPSSGPAAPATAPSATGAQPDDQSCSYKLSAAAAWTREGSVSSTSSDSSREEPLSQTRRRLSEAKPATPPTPAQPRKRKRVSSAAERPADQEKPRAPPAPWWTTAQASANWYQMANAAASASAAPSPAPNASAGESASVSLPRREQRTVEPFLSPLRPPLPTIQQRAERVAEAQEAALRSDSEGDSEEEVAQYLKRPRRGKSSSRGGARGTREESPTVTFLPRQRLLADSALVLVEDVMFHLPRSRIMQNSEYFAKHLAKTQESNDSEGQSHLDRCSVVKVAGVSAEDFEALLTVCDDIGSFIEKQPSFRTLAAVFCVSRALRFGQIDALATYKLVNMWPNDLHKLSPVRTPYAAETVVLARTYDVPSVLKRAFYELLRSEGFAQQGINVDGAALDGSRLVGNARLSHADLVRLVTTREKLSMAWTLLVGSAPSPASFPCMLQHTTASNAAYSTNTARERCAAACTNSAAIWAEWVLDSGLFENWMYDPICGLERLSILDWENSGYCSSCVMTRRQLWSRKREEIWENLDTWLGL